MGFSIANKITIIRIALVPVFITTVLYFGSGQDYLRPIALAIFLIMVITDVIDGYIAKKGKQTTKSGAILDPLADKVLLISAFLTLYNVGDAFEGIRFPMWLVIFVISRDVTLIAGSMIIYLVKGDLYIKPTIMGKAAVFFQVMCIIGIFLQLSFSKIFWYAALVLSILSLVQYLFLGVLKLNNDGREV
jgi:CDP-diacylglycerol--glycerol-3-phosphate 3-phosphatidyltransferase